MRASSLLASVGTVRGAAAVAVSRAAGTPDARAACAAPACWHPQKCAQVLLTLDNLANRSQFICAKNTFEELLR